MKFSEITQEDWANLQPYMDTCLIPVSGLDGSESPWEATQILENLRDALELIELPYKGRVVTYPAIHYTDDPVASSQVDTVCMKLRAAGFKHIIVMSVNPMIAPWTLPQADLLLYVDTQELKQSYSEIKRKISSQVQQLWSSIHATRIIGN